MRPGPRWLVLLLLALGTAVVLARLPPAPVPSESVELELAPAGRTPPFRDALEPVEFRYPRDHGAHFDFQTEWWYFTGNLVSEDGSRFGYQLTIFRRGLSPGLAQRSSELAANHLYFAHLALSDIASGEHRALERFSRGAAGLAGAAIEAMEVHLGDWTVQMDDQRIELQAAQDDLQLTLSMRPRKPPVAHGDRGLSAKGERPGNASYYVSLTDLETTGWIEVRGRRTQVQGSSWFDHEWGTSALGPEAVGWDWFGLQLEDGRDLMLFQLRRRDGGVEPFSGGTLVAADGRAHHLTLDQVSLSVLESWRSPESGAEYPIRWRIQIPSAGLDLQVEPLLQDQENRLGIVYWEGAVRVTGSHQGLGYLELTGYSADLQGLY